VLLRLARSEVTPAKPPGADTESDIWLSAFKKWGLPAPHGEALTIESREIRFVWRDHRVAADIGQIPDEVTAAADSIGFALVCLPAQPAEAPPADLADRPTMSLDIRAPYMANGRCRMHGGPSPGAPKGSRNAFKHGRYTTMAIGDHRKIAALLGAMRELARHA
jgi:hypothetical protein